MTATVRKQFEADFTRYYRPLCLFALHYTQSHEAAEDIVQQLFTEIWERIRQDRFDVAALKPYLYTAVKNRCLKWLAKQQTVSLQESDSASLSEEEADQVAEAEREDALWRWIDELPAECRRVFLLAKQQQLSYKEIARQLQISEKTVENHIGKALKRLREKARNIYLFFLGFRVGETGKNGSYC